MSSLATCQRCHDQFDTNTNRIDSCKFHRSLYVCRLHTEGEDYYGVDVGDWNGKFWDCCGAETPDANPCAMGKHVPYDTEWTKDSDRFAADNTSSHGRFVPCPLVFHCKKIFHSKPVFTCNKTSFERSFTSMAQSIDAQSSSDNGPPFQCPKLSSNSIMDLIRKSEVIALENAFLMTYTPKPETKVMNDLKYTVCLAENLANKPNPNKMKKPNGNGSGKNGNDSGKKEKKKKPFDPFAGPFVSGSHVLDLGTSNEYRLILNKFPVLPQHVLLISSDWVSQTDPLNASDLDTAWKVFESLRIDNGNENPMMFLNSGRMSGATQMHRHLHLIPNCGPSLLINVIADSLIDGNGKSKKQKEDEEVESEEKKQHENDMEKGMVLQFGGFTFLHGIILLDDIENVDGTMLTKYYEVLMQWMKDTVESDEIAYNLIITERVMMMVPRKQDAFCGEIDDDEESDGKKEVTFAINAMPLAGMVFCNSVDQIKLLNDVGITKMIEYCCYPNGTDE